MSKRSERLTNAAKKKAAVSSSSLKRARPTRAELRQRREARALRDADADRASLTVYAPPRAVKRMGPPE